MKANWDDCNVLVQAKLLAYDQTRQHDEYEEAKALAGVGKTTASSQLGRSRSSKRGRRR